MTPTDFFIIQAVLDGDREAYAELVRRYHGKVLGLCRSFMPDLPSAEEAAQDSFVKAFEQLSRFRSQSAFGTWLYRIAANHCKDLLRAQARRRAEPLDTVLNNNQEPIVSNDRDLEQKDLAHRLLNQLSPDERAILSMRETAGLSYVEIAECMGLSLDAVKGRLKRAREKCLDLARHFLASENV